MTVLEHIKQLVIGLTDTEKRDLATCLANPELATHEPHSLRGDWSIAFSNEADLDEELKEIRDKWQKEWCFGDFIG
jgi:hypothetical protein